MSTVEAKRMTAEEFLEFVYRPENVDRFFELESGEVIEMPPPGRLHGVVCGNSSRILGNFAVKIKKGYVCTNDSGFIVERDPDTVRGADVAYYDDVARYADVPKRYEDPLPKLAMEVLSPDTQWSKMQRRVKQFLKRGVQMVWVADPEARTITVCRLGREMQILEEHDEIDGEDVLPGFRCKVADFFKLPGEGEPT